MKQKRTINARRMARIFLTNGFAHKLNILERSARSILRQNKCVENFPDGDLDSGSFHGDFYIPATASNDARIAAELLWEISFQAEARNADAANNSRLKIGALAVRLGLSGIFEDAECGNKVRGGGKKGFATAYGTPENRQQENAELQKCLEKCLDDHPEWNVTGARIEVVRLLGKKYKITDYKTVERRTTNPRKAMQNN